MLVHNVGKVPGGSSSRRPLRMAVKRSGREKARRRETAGNAPIGPPSSGHAETTSSPSHGQGQDSRTAAASGLCCDEAPDRPATAPRPARCACTVAVPVDAGPHQVCGHGATRVVVVRSGVPRHGWSSGRSGSPGRAEHHPCRTSAGQDDLPRSRGEDAQLAGEAVGIENHGVWVPMSSTEGGAQGAGGAVRAQRGGAGVLTRVFPRSSRSDRARRGPGPGESRGRFIGPLPRSPHPPLTKSGGRGNSHAAGPERARGRRRAQQQAGEARTRPLPHPGRAAAVAVEVPGLGVAGGETGQGGLWVSGGRDKAGRHD